MPPNELNNALDHQSTTIKRITLTNDNLMQVTLCNFGARILSIKVPNKANRLFETTLNHTTDEDIKSDTAYMGATCGRVSNRIAGAKYAHNNKDVQLKANEGQNMLHGGANSFSHRFWSMASSDENAGTSSVTFTLFSPANDQGFPGNLTASVTYTLTNQNALIIDFAASCDADCPINMCNHTYFTLGEKSIHELVLQVFAEQYLPVDKNSIPTGSFADTRGSDFDFTEPQTLKDKINIRDFDECFVMNKAHNARLISKQNALALDIYSDQAGMQVYTGNFLPTKYQGIALEAQGLIDAVNQASFETDWVGPDNNYAKTIKYHFSAL